MSLNELTVELGFEADLQKRTVRTDRSGAGQPRFDQKNKEYRFEETLGLTASGHFVDEKVLLYDAMIRGGLSQERFTESGPGLSFDKTQTPHGDIFEYDFRLQAFPAGKVSSTSYASKLDDRVPRPFLPSLDRTRERYGTGLFYNDPKLPMRLTYDHLFDELSSGNRYLEDNEELGEDTLRYEATWQPTDDHALNLEYEYERRSDRYSGTETRFDTTRNYFALNDAIQFGQDKRSRLDTIVRIEEERGDLPRDSYEFAPLLRLQHTESLFTTYRFQALKQKYLELETDTRRGDWSITHQLDKLLTSTLGFYGLQQDSNDNADYCEWGSLTNFSLSKDNQWGNFSGNLSYLHSQSDTSDGRRGGVVVDESVTFRDPLPSYLAQRNVQRFTIAVRDPAGLRFFLEGRDYLVVQIRDTTALQRVPTGFINDRQTVMVSYLYEVADNFHVDRDRIDLRLQQDFKFGLTPYYALSWQDEKIDPQRYLTYDDRNINRHRVGAIYRKPRWSIGPEYEFNDDSIDPYQALHVNADVTLLQNERHQLTARGSNSYFRFEGTDDLEERYTTLLDLGLTHRYILAPRLEVSSTALFRFENDSLFGETQGVDLTSAVSYRIGDLTVLIEAEYDMLDLPTSTDNSMGLWLKVRREIPIIGRPRG
ncbi:MAG TPA: hypothetical protein VJZ71_03925 [Phycisphaerae bacterium]|nr:hypothetical protein [Phycisphaerae bacterium]